MIDLEEEAQLLLGCYLKAQGRPAPPRGSGSIQLAFQLQPGQRPPQFDPLIRVLGEGAWLIRWPNGTIRWVSETQLQARGFTLPARPLVADVDVDGTLTVYWEPPLDPNE